MNFELKKFGRKIKSVRTNLALTQEDVFRKIGINTETLRRIENGSVLPKFETLDLLSEVYKIDVCQIILSHRVSDYRSYENVKILLEKKLADQNKEIDNNLIKTIETVYAETNNVIYKNLLNQLLYYYKGVNLMLNNELDEAEVMILRAIKVTTPEFEFVDFKKFYYSNIELRILSQLARISSIQGNNKKAVNILKFCIKNIRQDSNLVITMQLNLALLYNIMEKYKESLEVTHKVIDHIRDAMNFKLMAFALFTQGRAEFRLNDPNYKLSFINSLNLLQAYGYRNRFTKFKSIIENELNIDLYDIYQEYTAEILKF